MIHNTGEESCIISPKIEDVSTVMETSDDQSLNGPSSNKYNHLNDHISDNDTPEYPPLFLTSDIKTEPKSCDDSIELYFDPKEWFINDSTTGKLRAPRQNEFLYFLLEDSRYSSYLSWLDRIEGLFKIHQPDRVVQLWTKVKNRQTNGTMDYDTFARGLRYYYQLGIMIKTHRKYTFRFKMSTNSLLVNK
ncbi:hypothetical protein I4U23_008649 [Adineta vaga]|nr:hypothetical protein I4U23_008649 [Adineta vaga]